ncbi:uncharacterized protein LOC144340762 isoform X5 [Macaca mulatta]
MEGAYEMCRAVCYVSANSRRKHGHGNTWSLHRKTRVMEAAELLSRPGVSRGTAECLGGNLIVFPRPGNPGLTGANILTVADIKLLTWYDRTRNRKRCKPV